MKQMPIYLLSISELRALVIMSEIPSNLDYNFFCKNEYKRGAFTCYDKSDSWVILPKYPKHYYLFKKIMAVDIFAITQEWKEL